MNSRLISRIAKNICADYINQGLAASKTPKNACRFLNNLLREYTKGKFDNSDKSYSAVNKAKEMLFSLGMKLEDKKEHIVTHGKSWRDEYTFSFVNKEGKEIKLFCQFNIMLDGTVEDNELSYDFTFLADPIIEDWETPVYPNDKILASKKNATQACKYISDMVDYLTHDVYSNENHDWKAFRQARDIIDSLGMETVDIVESKEEGNWNTTLEHLRFVNDEGKTIDLYCRYNIYYAGTTEDPKSSYDFTVQLDPKRD